MKKVYSKRVLSQKRSFVREILDSADDPSFISFAGGLPDNSLFPIKEIKKSAKKLLKRDRSSIFQYSSSKGLESLREELAKNYTDTTSENILITSGAQQALDIVSKAFIDKNDIVVVESPTYLSALNLFKMYDADIKSVKLHKNGIDLEDLKMIFKEGGVKFFYTIPSFQNPTSITWSNENKKAVASLAKRNGVIIIEDSPYEVLRYEDIKITTFNSLLPNQTITIGTFSKTLAPDFRIGWIRAKKDMIDIFQTVKENSDLQSSKFFQYIAVELIRKGYYQKHINLLRKNYKKKRDICAKYLKKYLGDEVEFDIPKGGMFFWVKFHHIKDSSKLLEFAIKQGVVFVPGEVFFADRKPSSYIRVNFTNSSFKDLKEGIKRMKRVYEKFVSISTELMLSLLLFQLS